MDVLFIMFISVIMVMTALTFIEVRRIRKNLQQKPPQSRAEVNSE